MAKIPIDWKVILPGRDDDPPQEVVVVASASSSPAGAGGAGIEAAAAAAAQTEGYNVADLSMHELHEKINRISKHLSGLAGRLPDRGVKLRSSLQLHQEELKRRNLARIHKGIGESEKDTASNSAIPADSLEDSPKDKTDAAFSEELGFISCKRPRENGCQMQEGRYSPQNSLQKHKLSSKEIHTACFYNKAKHKVSESDHKATESSGISSLPARRCLSKRLAKRRGSVSRDSMDMDFRKVQEVVLLDDEDAQPMKPIQGGDTPDEWKESKIYYPSRDDPECVELSYGDIACLDPEQYISSPIMNFYIQYLQRSVSPAGRPRGEYCIFNTYFYRKLEEAVSSKGDRTGSFSKLRRWWKGVNIFQKAYIVMPIHGDQHWSLVIICIPAKEDESGPIILHLDSLGYHHSNQIFATVDSYLKEEWNCINQDAPLPDLPISERIWKNLPRRIEKKKLMVPQQKNDYDCGLFVLYFMERFIREAPGRLRKKDLDMFGSKWFKPEEASGLRKRIRELLLEEFESSRLENGIAESPGSSGTTESDKEQGSKPLHIHGNDVQPVHLSYESKASELTELAGRIMES